MAFWGQLVNCGGFTVHYWCQQSRHRLEKAWQVSGFFVPGQPEELISHQTPTQGKRLSAYQQTRYATIALGDHVLWN